MARTHESDMNLDAAPFGRIASWDPNRSQGARASHVEEFLADDLFLSTPLRPDRKGNYQPAVLADGQSCIGVEWDIRRNLKELTIRFAESSPLPSPEKAGVGCWQGYSAWQGGWIGLAGKLTAEEGGRLWRFAIEHPQKATQKIRFRFFDAEPGLAVQELTAETLSTMTQCQIALCGTDAKDKSAGEIGIVNGQIADGDGWSTTKSWDGRSTQALTVRYATPGSASHSKSDRTMLQFRSQDHSFGVALDDVLDRGPVYVAEAGVYVAKSPLIETPSQYKERIAGKKTILEEVRGMPEQTREQAMSKTHYNPTLDHGAMMVSLACDNDKFIVERDGTIRFYKSFLKSGGWKGVPPDYRLMPRYGYQRILSATQDWGKLGLDTSVNPGNGGAPLRIGNKTYKRGLGHHANGEISVNLKGEFERFESEVGVQSQGQNNTGSVVFQVLVDDKVKFDSGIMRSMDAAKSISLPLSGATTLTLKITDAGDGIACDVADWAEARLIPRGSESAEYLSDSFRKGSAVSRHLADGWLPAPMNTMEVDGLTYTQKTYVVPFEKAGIDSLAKQTDPVPVFLNAKPLGVIEITIENPQAKSATASASLAFAPNAAETNKASIATTPARSIFGSNGEVLAVVDSSEMQSSEVGSMGSVWHISAEIPAKATRTLYVYLPTWSVPTAQQSELTGGRQLFPLLKSYWDQIMTPTMQVSLPDEWLTNVIRANLVHILLAARNSEGGARIHPWIASESYPAALDSEGNSPLRAMIDFGHYEFARRAFEYYFANYKPGGFMTTGYTLMGNGWHLWTLAEFLELSQDQDWFRQREAKSVGLCDWVMRQREKTKKILPGGERVWEYGLMPPGTQADWAAFAYYFCSNSHFQKGLERLGQTLSQWHYKEGKQILADAEDFRKDILQAYQHTRALSPVVPLRNGNWVPFAPCAVHTSGPIGDFYPGEDAKRSWAYDVELGAHQMVALDVMPPANSHVDDMMNYMEDYYFLADGWGAYPAKMNQADWFNMGGFAKMQPYYARNAEIYALRDDVKPFLRSYFNTIASLIDGDVLSFYEHLSANCINKTHETGYFLRQSRLMLLMERGEELWLTPFAPREWLSDGKVTEVRNAPTRFGPVSYRIESAAGKGFVQATIEPPTRSQPQILVLRLRHPEEKAIQSVEVNGGSVVQTDRAKEIVRIKPSGGTVTVRAMY